MDQLLIRGGRPLQGEITISGAKNAALPELCAALLVPGPVTLRNVPRLQDVRTTLKLLRQMGATARWGDEGEGGASETADVVADAERAHELTVDAGPVNNPVAPYELVKTMRASILVLGPLLARFGVAIVSLPGGCAIGSRPVDQHIKGLQAMGAQITVERGNIIAKTHRLKGARITTDMVTVTGTENLMMAATLAQGETLLENAAQEPEIPDLAELLISMGARIEGHGTSRIRIQGVDALHPPAQPHHIIPDRIETGTYAMCAGMTGGDVLLQNANAAHIGAVIDVMRQAGIDVEAVTGGIRVRRDGGLLQPVRVETAPFPAFPTDCQAQLMALMTMASGASFIRETIFENRFMHVQELARLGADIHLHGDTAEIRGVRKLTGAPVMATDLRASVSLVIAGLAAAGETTINRVYHLDRGFETLEEKLSACGADVTRLTG